MNDCYNSGPAQVFSCATDNRTDGKALEVFRGEAEMLFPKALESLCDPARIGAKSAVRLKWGFLACLGVCLGTAAVSFRFWPGAPFQPTVDAASLAASLPETTEPIKPIPIHIDLDPRKVVLGRALFHDRRLSHDNEVSCASCHGLSTGGTDRMARSVGIHGVIGKINAPTVLNSGFSFRQFWDGRAETLEGQIDGPVQDPDEMGSTWPEVTSKLSAVPAIAAAFRAIYPDGVRSENIKDSIAVFERSLYTPNSPFDRYLRGDKTALTKNAEQGYRLFKTLGCASCHQGVNVGGNMYQTLGVMGPYFTDRGHITKADLGRFNVTGNPQDRYMFKVPTLRNVALTPPYFHDASVGNLGAAVLVMAKYQLGRRLSTEETQLLVEFLGSLTGELDGKPL